MAMQLGLPGDTTAGDLGAVQGAATIASGAADVYVQAATLVTPTAAGVKCTTELAKEFLNAERMGNALNKADAAHRAASFLTQEELQAGKTFLFKGGDGVERTLLQVEGPALNGQSGIYEYILDPSGKVTH